MLAAADRAEAAHTLEYFAGTDIQSDGDTSDRRLILRLQPMLDAAADSLTAESRAAAEAAATRLNRDEALQLAIAHVGALTRDLGQARA